MIGKKGAEIEKLKVELSKLTRKEIRAQEAIHDKRRLRTAVHDPDLVHGDREVIDSRQADPERHAVRRH